MFNIILGNGLRLTTLTSRLSFLGRKSVLPAVGRPFSNRDHQPLTEHSSIPEPFIPPYRPREREPVETIKARLLYQSRKRGMLENGLLLSTFAAKFLDSMTEPELRDYDHLINLPSNDWDIYYWATGVKPIPAEFNTPMMHKFIGHVQNSNKESRIRQPDLNEEN